jgi:WD40 repeat protein
MVRMWDPRTGQLLHTLIGDTSGVRAFAIGRDGAWLASAGGYSEGMVQVWDVEAESCIASLRIAHSLECVVTDGRRIIASGARGPYFLTIKGH